MELSEYVLEQVQMVIRHGDRSSLHTLPNYIEPSLSCKMDDYPHLFSHIPNVDSYKETLVNNMKHLANIPNLSMFGLHPSQELCKPGYLTPVGATQHIKNGAFLKENYKKWNLVEKPGRQKQVKLVTTNRRRTFQSGVALLYGFFSSLDLSTIDINVTPTSSMCVDSGNGKFPCKCEAADKYHNIIANSFGQTNANMTHEPGYVEHTMKIAQVFGVMAHEVPRASHIMDVGMVHVCHDLPLPGRLTNCMDPQSLRYVVDAINKNGKKNTNDGTYKRLARLRMLPLLGQIYDGMMDRISGKSSHKLVLYSGHDSTIDPLLVTLNISLGIWPKYASRFTVELYSTRAAHIPKAYFVRILYNGRDLTQNVMFCKSLTPSGLCSLDHFKRFLLEENGVTDLNLKDYQSECLKPFSFETR